MNTHLLQKPEEEEEMSRITPLPFKPRSRYRLPRLEVFSMHFSKSYSDDEISDGRSHKNHIWNKIFYEMGEDPLKDLFKSVKCTDVFRGRIFIADSCTLHEIYNSETLSSLYTDVPKKMNRKRKIGLTDLAEGADEDEMQNSADSEETELPSKKEKQNLDDYGKTDLPLMGPEVAMEILGDMFLLIVHPESDQADAESQYYGLAKTRYHRGLHPLIPNDDGGLCRLSSYNIKKKFDNLFDFSIVTAYGLLRLDCIVFSHSKAVYLEVKWIKEGGDVTDMYVCGRLTVINAEYQDKESVIFDTPPNKAMHAPRGDIKLLRRVVAVPYDSEFEVEVDLCCSYSIDGVNSPFSQMVDDFIIFPNLNDDIDARWSNFIPEDLHILRSRPPLVYESKKSIRGYGGSLEVNAYVDIK